MHYKDKKFFFKLIQEIFIENNLNNKTICIKYNNKDCGKTMHQYNDCAIMYSNNDFIMN